MNLKRVKKISDAGKRDKVRRLLRFMAKSETEEVTDAKGCPYEALIQDIEALGVSSADAEMVVNKFKESMKKSDSKKIKDSEEYHTVEGLIDKDKVNELYTNGQISISAPDDIDQNKFAEAIIERVNDLWGDAEVGVAWDDVDVNVDFIEGNTVVSVHKKD